jgi:hypothetical protein
MRLFERRGTGYDGRITRAMRLRQGETRSGLAESRSWQLGRCSAEGQGRGGGEDPNCICTSIASSAR